MSRFAPERGVTEEGWYLFPRDTTYRKDLFPDSVREHPAKMNMYLLEAIVDYVSKPGETILDPFGGVGTTLLSSIRGRNCILIELEDEYRAIQNNVINAWRERGLVSDSVNIILLGGDNRKVLPVPCDHVVTSPPYAQTMQGGSDRFGRGQSREVMSKYQSSIHNIGNLNPFMYAQGMQRIYELLGQSIRPGGTLSVVIKDQMQGPTRVFHSEPCIKACVNNGFRLREWLKWAPPGTAFASLHKSKGHNVVEDEDILIFERE